MVDRRIVERIISQERLEPYLKWHNNDLTKALNHYKCNIGYFGDTDPLFR